MASLWFSSSSFFISPFFHQHFVFSLDKHFSPCILICSITPPPASLIGFYDLPFVARCLRYLHHHPSFPPTISSHHIGDVIAKLGPPRPAWQGTDLMHNHVLADVDRSCMDSPGRRSSVSRPELSSDLSEDSDYDSIWTTHSYRMGSVPRKSCISHQN